MVDYCFKTNILLYIEIARTLINQHEFTSKWVVIYRFTVNQNAIMDLWPSHWRRKNWMNDDPPKTENFEPFLCLMITLHGGFSK